MKVVLIALAGMLASAVTAQAGGNSAGIGAGAGNALPQAEAQSLCVQAMRREMAGGPPVPAWCGYQAPPPAYVAPTRSYAAPTRCVTRPNIPGSLGTVYQTTCY